VVKTKSADWRIPVICGINNTGLSNVLILQKSIATLEIRIGYCEAGIVRIFYRASGQDKYRILVAITVCCSINHIIFYCIFCSFFVVQHWIRCTVSVLRVCSMVPSLSYTAHNIAQDAAVMKGVAYSVGDSEQS